MSSSQADVNPYFDLDTWPLWTPDQASHEPLGETIRIMKISGFRKLGFAMVCGNDDDQDAWDRLVARIRQSAYDHLGIRQELLGRFLDFPVLGDSDSEEGQGVAANLEEACAIFAKWSRSNAISGFNNLPRFNYFVYVDKTCLDSLVQREKWEAENPENVDIWTCGPLCYVKLVRAEQQGPERGVNFMTEDLALLRRQAEQIAAANPQMAEAVFAELASAEVAAGFTGTSAGAQGENSHRVIEETPNDGGDESEDESEASNFSEPDSHWFQVHVSPLLELYNMLHDQTNWDLCYVRPPEVSRG